MRILDVSILIVNTLSLLCYLMFTALLVTNIRKLKAEGVETALHYKINYIFILCIVSCCITMGFNIFSLVIHQENAGEFLTKA